MSLRQAYQLCPNGSFIRGDYQVYQAFSEKFFRLLRGYTPDIEEASLDEAYLDLTRCRHLYPCFSAAAGQMKARVERETGLEVSVGMAPNRILAKGFLPWILVANALAWPVGYLAMKSWLGSFAYRVGLTPWPSPP